MTVLDAADHFIYSITDYSALVAQLETNIPADSLALVDVYDPSGIVKIATIVKVAGTSSIRFLKSLLANQAVKVVVRSYGVDGVSWKDNFVYQDGIQTIEFTSQGSGSGGSGEQKTFSGSVALAGGPVERQVYALAVDGEQSKLLASAMSGADGHYQLAWQGYTGKIMVLAADDYGRPFTAGEVLSVGDRIHPGTPNGYVYEVSGAGALGVSEPLWPAENAAVIVSGEVQLTAKPFYRPKAAGPFIVS